VTTKTHISYSEISDWRQCKRKHRLGWVDQWRKPEPARPLKLGSLWHDVMEAHHTGQEEAVGLLLDDQPEKIETGILAGYSATEDLTPVLRWMYEGYVERYGPGRDEPFRVIEAEKFWMVELPNPRTHVTHLKVKLDLLIEFFGDNTQQVWDHKSGASAPDIYGLELDPQFAFYVWAARMLGYNCKMAVRNFARTKQLKRAMTLEERFIRHPIVFTKAMVDAAIADLEGDLELMALGMDGRTPGNDCSWKCGYREACQASYRKPGLEVPVLLETGHERPNGLKLGDPVPNVPIKVIGR
jgi:hypothetical protein